MEPWQSWAAALLVGGGLAYYYTRDSNVLGKANRATPTTEQPQVSTARRRQDKQGARNKDTAPKLAERTNDAAAVVAETLSSALPETLKSSKKRKAGKEPTSTQSSVPSIDSSDADAEKDDVDDGGEWARQLEAKKKGISLNTPSALKTPQQGLSTLPVDTSNGDSAGQLIAKSNTMAPAGGDVSDMLEARAPGPSVLRLTGEEKPKKQLPPKAAPVQETKKQRQNRRKVEEQRLVRETQEKERQALLENQRRTAREARGEPARNGLATAQAPTSSAWLTSLRPTKNVADGAGTAPLLDTFEQDGVSTASSNEIPTNVTTPATAASAIDQDLPPEEVQLEMLNEMNGWNEVAKGKKGKKKGQTQAPSYPEESSAKESEPRPSTSIATRSVANGVGASTLSKAKETSSLNGFAALEDPITHAPGVKGHPDDSDWL